MNARMNEFWKQLNERDRSMFVVGVVICFFYLFYTLLYAPLSGSVDERREQLIEKKATYAWMKQVRPQAHQGKAREVLDAPHLLTVLSDQLRSISFHDYPYQLQQAGPKDIQLLFEEVPYNASMAWLSSVSQGYAFSIKQLQVDRTGKVGVVKLMWVIEVA